MGTLPKYHLHYVRVWIRNAGVNTKYIHPLSSSISIIPYLISKSTVWTVNDVLVDWHPFSFWSTFLLKRVWIDQNKKGRIWIDQDVIDGPHCSYILEILEKYWLIMICSHNYVGLRCYIVYSRIECLEIIWQKRQGANFDEFNANRSEFHCSIWINLRNFDFMKSMKEDWK